MPLCEEHHQRSHGERVADVRPRRRILAGPASVSPQARRKGMMSAMARNSEAYRTLRTVTHPELVAFCAACAERGSGIHRLLGEPEEAALFEEALSLGWNAARGEVDDEAVVDLVEEAEELLGCEDDEDDEDDTESRGFHATQSLMLAVNTLSVYLNPAPERAEMSGQTMETLLSGFDFTLGGERAVITRAGESSPVGDLQRLEQEAQTRFLASYIDGTGSLLRGTTPEEMRHSCLAARERIAHAVETLAELRGWEIRGTGAAPGRPRP
ncbi:hypothetical protein [Streptomyces macrosporus]|uniref:Uncharacterized protein n=1 Tax=Streptomyces macrosporus TaxID=44032 RepID=A0ABP5XB77_9ACTN